MYSNWIKSKPFDIGIATRNALNPLVEFDYKATNAIEVAKVSNANSQSNGSLMRITPLIVYGA